MNPRMAWFVAGTAAGVYGAIKARRAVYRLSMPGLIDQASALGSAWQYFRSEMEQGMTEKEQEFRIKALDTGFLHAADDPDSTVATHTEDYH